MGSSIFEIKFRHLHKTKKPSVFLPCEGKTNGQEGEVLLLRAGGRADVRVAGVVREPDELRIAV